MTDVPTVKPAQPTYGTAAPVLISIAGAYLVAVSFIYLFGYWWTFRINILEFIDTADILKHAAFPLASFVPFFFLGMAIGASAPHASTGTPPKRTTTMGRLWAFLLLANGAVIVVTLLVLNLYTALVGLMAVLLVGRYGVLELMNRSIIPRSIVSGAAAFSVLAVPIWSYVIADWRAEGIKRGTSFSVLEGSQIASLRDSPLLKSSGEFRYIGRAGEYLFLFNSERQSVLTVKLQPGDSTELRQVNHPLPLYPFAWIRADDRQATDKASVEKVGSLKPDSRCGAERNAGNTK